MFTVVLRTVRIALARDGTHIETCPRIDTISEETVHLALASKAEKAGDADVRGYRTVEFAKAEVVGRAVVVRVAVGHTDIRGLRLLDHHVSKAHFTRGTCRAVGPAAKLHAVGMVSL